MKKKTKASADVPVNYVGQDVVSRMIGVSERTLEHWRLFGRGPKYRKIGGAVRYHVGELERWLESCPSGGQERAAEAR